MLVHCICIKTYFFSFFPFEAFIEITSVEWRISPKILCDATFYDSHLQLHFPVRMCVLFTSRTMGESTFYDLSSFASLRCYLYVIYALFPSRSLTAAQRLEAWTHKNAIKCYCKHMRHTFLCKLQWIDDFKNSTLHSIHCIRSKRYSDNHFVILHTQTRWDWDHGVSRTECFKSKYHYIQN